MRGLGWAGGWGAGGGGRGAGATAAVLHACRATGAGADRGTSFCRPVLPPAVHGPLLGAGPQRHGRLLLHQRGVSAALCLLCAPRLCSPPICQPARRQRESCRVPHPARPPCPCTSLECSGLEKELAALISSKQITARIDSHAKARRRRRRPLLDAGVAEQRGAVGGRWPRLSSRSCRLLLPCPSHTALSAGAVRAQARPAQQHLRAGDQDGWVGQGQGQAAGPGSWVGQWMRVRRMGACCDPELLPPHLAPSPPSARRRGVPAQQPSAAAARVHHAARPHPGEWSDEGRAEMHVDACVIALCWRPVLTPPSPSFNSQSCRSLRAAAAAAAPTAPTAARGLQGGTAGTASGAATATAGSEQTVRVWRPPCGGAWAAAAAAAGTGTRALAFSMHAQPATASAHCT